jgi:hypothetical protein
VTDLLGRYVRHYLQAPFVAAAARRRRGLEIVCAGGRVVEGGMISATGWELRDWLTGEVVAGGHGGPAGMASVLSGMYHADNLYADVSAAEPATPEIPASLRRVVEEWVCDAATSDEDIAEVTGWSVGTVREHR